MESIFQNSVSEFDLNLFEQTTNVNQATPLIPCPEAQQLGISRLKTKVKRLSQVVHRAKQIDEVLLVLEKELLETEQELKETKSLLAEKIEENKVVCEERTAYYNQVTEKAIEIQNLKDQLDKVKNIDYDSKLKDRIINGYSDQVKGLQKELDDFKLDKKQNDKNATAALKHAKSGKALVEKKLIRLLKAYVIPTTKKRDRWLETIIKRYLPDARKGEVEESNKNEKPVDELDETIIDDEELSAETILQRNISVDFDYVESVDTGRGSSLAFSDGEKSFHSPDYYMDDSPPCAINVCNKCNIPHADASTSPISPEQSVTTDNSESSICKKCVLLKKDACTSPLPLQSFDISTNTSEVSIEVKTPKKDIASNAEENRTIIVPTHIVKINEVTHTTYNDESAYVESEHLPNEDNDDLQKHVCSPNKQTVCTPRKLQDFTFDTDDEDEDIASNSPVDELSKSPSVPFTEDVTSYQIVSKDASPSEVKSQNVGFDINENDETLGNIIIDQNHVVSPVTLPHSINAVKTNQPEKKLVLMPLNQQDNLKCDSDDEVMHDVNQIKSRVFSPVDFNDSESSCTNISNNDPQTTLAESPHRIADFNTKTNRKSSQELKCLELNNSKNCSNDVEIDSEIRRILNKMQLRHKMITPIHATPPPRITQSFEIPVEKQNAIISQQTQVITEAINEQMDLLRAKVQEVFTPFVKTMPQCLEQIPRLFSRGGLNEELLRNLLYDPNRSHEKHSHNTFEFSSYNALTDSNDRLQPNVVELNTDSMLCLTKTGDNERFACGDCTIFENSESEYQIAHIEYDNSQDEICALNKEINHVNNKLHNSALSKAKKSNDVFSANDNTMHENTHVSRVDSIENNNKLSSIVNTSSAATLSEMKSRRSIVYEGKDFSDNDDDIQISKLIDSNKDLNGNSEKILRNKKGKKKKNTTLETLRLKMLPKSKIKNDNKTVRKLRSRPIPINTISKKKVKESDTAASLNDKAVYENAVAAFKLVKDLKIVVKDCNHHTQNTSEAEGVKINENIHDIKAQLTVTENIKNDKKGSENLKLDSNDQSRFIDTTKVQRNDISLKETVSDISPFKLSCEVSEKEMLSTKRAHEAVHSSSEMVKPKRKRISVSDVQNLNRNSNVEPNSPRILRSASHVKPNKEKELEDKSAVTTSRERLRSKSDQVKSDINTNDIILVSKKSRLARKATGLGSECTQDEQNNSIVSVISKKKNNSAISSANLSLLCNKDTEDETKDLHDANISPLGRKPRIDRQSARTGFKNMQDKINSSKACDISMENDRTVSYADLSLFSNEDTQDETKTDFDINDNSRSPIRRKPRITRQRMRPESNSPSKCSNASDSPRNERNRDVFCEDLSLYRNENKQDQIVENKKLECTNNTIPTHNEKVGKNKLKTDDCSKFSKSRISSQNESQVKEIFKNNGENAISYADLNLFSEDDCREQLSPDVYRKDSLLCSMIQKYGVQKIKFVAKQVSDSKVNELSQKLETSLSEILDLPHGECMHAMKKLVEEIRAWNVKHFIHGFIKYLRNPERKIELFNKSFCPPFPPMTKKEQVLLYVLDELQKSYDYRNIVQKILTNIEYTLFALNKTAESYDAIEAMAHFYALLCRSYQRISQLRLFVIDAMYCLQLRSIILVQQCLEVWMSVLPLGHMGLAKCPLVTCLVYLLHFYKCEDKFKRVQDIRNTLRWKYNYEMADWNENKILEVFRTAIIEIRDSPMERKALRLSLLILAKRHGAKWCHTNIVTNMLQPLINDSSTTDRARRFCVSILGPLMKPYPSNMKVHYEMVIDYLVDMLNGKNSPKMQEAIISSLIYVDKNNNRFLGFLAKWCPKQVSPEFQIVFKDYVRSRPIHAWKKILSWEIF